MKHPKSILYVPPKKEEDEIKEKTVLEKAGD